MDLNILEQSGLKGSLMSEVRHIARPAVQQETSRVQDTDQLPFDFPSLLWIVRSSKDVIYVAVVSERSRAYRKAHNLVVGQLTQHPQRQVGGGGGSIRHGCRAILTGLSARVRSLKDLLPVSVLGTHPHLAEHLDDVGGECVSEKSPTR